MKNRSFNAAILSATLEDNAKVGQGVDVSFLRARRMMNVRIILGERPLNQ